MTPEIVTLCHAAMTHPDSTMSVLGAFDQITVPDFSHPFPSFTLACRLRFDAAEAGHHALKVTVADTDGRVLAQLTATFLIAPVPPRPTDSLNIVFPISGMELRCGGEHVIDFVLDDVPALRVPFRDFSPNPTA
jgi:hypothetical protein